MMFMLNAIAPLPILIPIKHTICKKILYVIFGNEEAQQWCAVNNNNDSELILGLRPTNERRRYFVTTSLIGWAQA